MPHLSSNLEILTNAEIRPEEAHEFKSRVFLNEPCESIQGLEFLLRYGKVFVLRDNLTGKIVGIEESVPIGVLLSSEREMDLYRLPLQSPLRLIFENEKRYKILRSIKEAYPGKSEYHYAHGIAVEPQGIGRGSILFEERVKEISGADSLLFGFIMAVPVNDRSLGLYFKHGAVIDRVESHVYEPNKTYFRAVYYKRLEKLAEHCRIKLTALNLLEIRRHFELGFVGTKIVDGHLVLNRLAG